MTANELVEYYSKMLSEHQEAERLTVAEVEKYKYGGNKPRCCSFASEIDRYSSLLSILDRTRIRVTAEEKPTREDADARGNILAKHHQMDYFEPMCYELLLPQEVAHLHPYWTCMPRLPEVT